MPGKQRKNALLLDWGFRVQEFESSGKKGFLVLGLAFRGGVFSAVLQGRKAAARTAAESLRWLCDSQLPCCRDAILVFSNVATTMLIIGSVCYSIFCWLWVPSVKCHGSETWMEAATAQVLQVSRFSAFSLGVQQPLSSSLRATLQGHELVGSFCLWGDWG